MSYSNLMRTTLTLDDDVLDAVRIIAARTGQTMGQVVSDLARSALEKAPRRISFRNGVALLPDRGGPAITTEHVNALREELDWPLSVSRRASED